jgi:acetyl-CoA acyltransferase
MCIGLGMGAAVIWENPHHAGYGTAAVGTTTTETGAAA